jgi:hypothetical protein
MNGKRVGVYLRVSTGDQTVENQRQALIEAATHQGWRVVEEFVDNGISGTKAATSDPHLTGCSRRSPAAKSMSLQPCRSISSADHCKTSSAFSES